MNQVGMRNSKRSKLAVTAAVCGLLLAIGSVAHAGNFTLRQKTYIESEVKSFEREAGIMNRRCETQMKTNIDWASFRTEIDKILDGESRVSVSGYCKQALGAMSMMCRDSDAAKGAIKSGIQSYTCHFGGEGKRNMALKDGHLHMSVDFKAKNYSRFVVDFVGRSI